MFDDLFPVTWAGRRATVLQAVGGLPAEAARARLAEALDQLDDAIGELRNYALVSGDQDRTAPLGLIRPHQDS